MNKLFVTLTISIFLATFAYASEGAADMQQGSDGMRGKMHTEMNGEMQEDMAGSMKSKDCMCGSECKCAEVMMQKGMKNSDCKCGDDCACGSMEMKDDMKGGMKKAM